MDDLTGLMTFEKVIVDPSDFLHSLSKKCCRALAILIDRDGDLLEKESGGESFYGEGLDYVCQSVCSTYRKMLKNGPDFLSKERLRRIPERLVQGPPLASNESTSVGQIPYDLDLSTMPPGKACLMRIAMLNGSKGREIIKKLWLKILKAIALDMQYVVVRFLAPIIMAKGESISNRSWGGDQDPRPEFLVDAKFENPYFSAVIRRSDTETMGKYPSFYRLTSKLKYNLDRWTGTPAEVHLFENEMIRDLSLFEGHTPTEFFGVGCIIYEHMKEYLMELPLCRPGSGGMPRHCTLSKVFNFLVKADCINKNWFLCSFMGARYPQWDEKFVVTPPPGVQKDDIQFFDFYSADVDDEECTESYMQAILQASTQITGLLEDRCGCTLEPIGDANVVSRMRDMLRTRRVLRSKRALRWMNDVRDTLEKRASLILREHFLDELLEKTKMKAGRKFPASRTRAAAFLRAVVHARLRASGELLLFN